MSGDLGAACILNRDRSEIPARLPWTYYVQTSRLSAADSVPAQQLSQLLAADVV